MIRICPPKQFLRFAIPLFGVALLASLLRRTGVPDLIHEIRAVGWGIVLVIALGGITHLVKTWSWRLTFLCDLRNVSFGRAFALRLLSEGIGKFGLPGQVLGETTRVFLLGSSVPVASSVSSAALDRGLYVLTSAIVSAIGIFAALVLLSLSETWRLYTVVSATALVMLLILSAVAIQQRWPVLTRCTQMLEHLPWCRSWLAGKKSVITSAENSLQQFCHDRPALFWSSFSLNLVCHGLALLEVYLVLHLMGFRISLLQALVVEALTKLINLIGAFNPGNVGTYEGGNILLVKLIGLGSATGITLSLCRRARSMFWTAMGALCLVVISRSAEVTGFRTIAACKFEGAA